jgi:transposase-like protein
MKIKVTSAPTITKAVIAAVVFTIVFLATNSNLPPCGDTAAVFNAGGCVVRQSYLHTACGWLALASLITGVVMFIVKQRKASS